MTIPHSTALTETGAVYADAAALAAALADTGMPADARTIYAGTRNSVAFTADGKYCIKAFGVPGLIKGLIYGNFRRSKARRAWENAHRLIFLGFDTPDPVCMVECRGTSRLDRSYYVCVAYHGWSTLRLVHQRSDYDSIAADLAAFILRLNRAGVWVKDFSPGNVLWRRDDEGKSHFALVDINRMEFGPMTFGRQMSHFSTIVDTPQATETLARHYAALTHGGSRTVDAALDAFRRKQAALQRHCKLKSVLRSLHLRK